MNAYPLEIILFYVTEYIEEIGAKKENNENLYVK
jgi:hypothetical protein